MLSLEGGAKLDALSAIDRLKGEEVILINEISLKSEREWLKHIIRRFPFWSSGHVRLGEISLELNDINTAYASAHAAILLGNTVRGKRLLGACYLRAKEGGNAVKILKEVFMDNPRDFSMIEDLGAAYMLEGDYKSAKEYLEQIPEAKRSSSVNAALLRVRK